VSNNRRRNDRRPTDPPRRHAWPASRWGAGLRSADGLDEWLWGWHAVVAALDNPARGTPSRLLATAERAQALRARSSASTPTEIIDPAAIARLLPLGAVHQGLALATRALAPVSIEALATPTAGVLVMLDQVTDPQNVGAIFRSAAAFGARGLILQERRAPSLSGALAKAAAGAIDRIGHARVVNLARTLEELEAMGWRAIGLDAEASGTLADTLDDAPTVLVMGAEHEGLRRLVREHCDAVARIEMTAGFDSLNVAAAAAVALYETARRRG